MCRGCPHDIEDPTAGVAGPIRVDHRGRRGPEGGGERRGDGIRHRGAPLLGVDDVAAPQAPALALAHVHGRHADAGRLDDARGGVPHHDVDTGQHPRVPGAERLHDEHRRVGGRDLRKSGQDRLAAGIHAGVGRHHRAAVLAGGLERLARPPADRGVSLCRGRVVREQRHRALHRAPEELAELLLAERLGGCQAVEPRGTGVMHAIGRLAHLPEPTGGVLGGDAVLVGQLGDGVPNPLVHGALGDLAAVQVDHGDAAEEGRRHDVEQLPAVTEHHQDVGTQPGQDLPRARGETGTVVEHRLGAHDAHRLGDRVDGLAQRRRPRAGPPPARRARRRHR